MYMLKEDLLSFVPLQQKGLTSKTHLYVKCHVTLNQFISDWHVLIISRNLNAILLPDISLYALYCPKSSVLFVYLSLMPL
jgi:hypothetical protein